MYKREQAIPRRANIKAYRSISAVNKDGDAVYLGDGRDLINYKSAQLLSQHLFKLYSRSTDLITLFGIRLTLRQRILRYLMEI